MLQQVSCATLVVADDVQLLLAKILATDQTVLWLLHHILDYLGRAQLYVLVGNSLRLLGRLGRGGSFGWGRSLDDGRNRAQGKMAG